MKKLSTEQQKLRTELIAELNEASESVRAVIAEVNQYITKNLNPTIEAYNKILPKVEAFRDGITAEMKVYYDDQTDKWQDGDAGSKYEDWKMDWEDLDTSEIEVVCEEDEPDMDHAEDLAKLAVKP